MPKLILASQSPQRKMLLEKLNISFSIAPADIDETILKGEKPIDYCKRITKEKAIKAHADNPKAVVLVGDSIVVAGRKILQKPTDVEDAKSMLKLCSGRRVYVYTGVCVVTPKGEFYEKMSKNWVKYKPITNPELESFLADEDNWQGSAGAMKTEKASGWLIKTIHGSYSGIMGLPLYETRNLLLKAGIIF